MSAIPIMKLYDQLTGALGKEAAENLTTFIDNKIDHGLESKFNILESKIDSLASNMATKADLFEVKAELVKEIARVDAKIGDSIKWMFVFWISQAAVTYGYLSLILKK